MTFPIWVIQVIKTLAYVLWMMKMKRDGHQTKVESLPTRLRNYLVITGSVGKRKAQATLSL
jgi:hypothetical protein